MKRNRSAQRGHAIVEFALMATVMMLLSFGAADFGRIFFDGGDDSIQAGEYSEMEARAKADAETDVGTVTVTAGQLCKCPDGDAFACEEFGVTTCSGYGVPRAYVRVQVEEPVNLLSIPFYPEATVRQEAWMRVR
jgi:hypothetical protein